VHESAQRPPSKIYPVSRALCRKGRRKVKGITLLVGLTISTIGRAAPASPEEVWAFYLSSMRSGNVEAAISVLSGQAERRYAGALRSASAEKLRYLVENTSDVLFGPKGNNSYYLEYESVQKYYGEEILSPVGFCFSGQDWKICNL
jgi:hypothetical protein